MTAVDSLKRKVNAKSQARSVDPIAEIYPGFRGQMSAGDLP